MKFGKTFLIPIVAFLGLCFIVLYVPGVQRFIISFNYIKENAFRPDFKDTELFMKGFPYLDAHCVIAAIVAERDGLNTSKSNPYDIWNRGHVYGKAWLWLKYTGLGLNHVELVGTLLALGFYLSVALLCVGLRPKELGLALLLGLSPPVVLAVNRGHVDFIIFYLLLFSSFLLIKFALWRTLLAMFVNLAAAFLKFFPAAIILWPALIVKGWQKSFYVVFGVVLIAGFLHFSYADIPKTSSEPWMRVAGPHTFGAAGFFTQMGFGHPAPMIFTAVAFLGLLVWIFRNPPPLVDSKSIGDWKYYSMVQSAIILVACFFLVQNYSYRLLFAMGMLPWVLNLLGNRSIAVSCRKDLLFWLFSLLFVAWGEFLMYWFVMCGHLIGWFAPQECTKSFENFLLFKDLGSWVFIAYTLRILYNFALPQVIPQIVIQRLYGVQTLKA